MQKPERILLWNLMAAVFALGQAWPNMMLSSQPSSGLKTGCVANLMRLTLDSALAVGNQLEVEAINGTQYILLTPSLAAQCGYSMESDPWGNARIYTSLLGCYVSNKDDVMFTVGLKLKIYHHSPSDVASHDVAQTCSYTRWAPREILCDRNYMEVSTYMAPQAEAKGQKKVASQLNTIPDQASEKVTGIWKITFFTPEPMSMVLKEAQQAGHSAMTTSTRLVMRSPYNTAETYSEDVAGVPMEVLKVSIYHKAQDGLNVFNLAAACPTGGVLFTGKLISWHVPRRVIPLLDGRIRLVEMNMGINGQRVDKAQMAARGYSLSTTDFHIVVEIPIGSPDGYYKSHAPDYQYHTTYTVEPMLEVLWRADQTREDTRYKILFPITTPPMLQPPHTEDRTIPEMREFSLYVGTFLGDVVLRNITFATGVLTVEESNARGFTVQQHVLANGTFVFSLQVPFDADVVYKHNPELLVTTYSLNVAFGFVILPEEIPFAHPVEFQASLHDVVLPTLTGTCDQDQFYITVKYGNQGKNFNTMVGGLDLTSELAEAYKFYSNATHFSIAVPYAATGTLFELITTNSVRARLDVLLWDPITNWILSDLFLACFFPLLTTRCYPNGTISALAVKVESVPNLHPSWLTLKDRSCTPIFSNDQFAQFTFSADSCGTTRTFFDHYVLYENEISLYYSEKGAARTSPVDPAYRQTVSCYYVVNDTQMVAFNAKSRRYEPKAAIGSGHMIVQMRLAIDSSYQDFYDAEDYPVEKYLREPLYFEVELVKSTDPHLELILENCWATLQEERTSLPSWDIIVDSCASPGDSYTTVFHTVLVDDSVSVPFHYKRFSMKMFAFIQEEQVLKHEVYVHCDLVICDTTSPAEGICQGQCANRVLKGTPKQTQRGRRSTSSTNRKQTSSRPILLNGFQ
ncbi:zona pellucida protein AX 1 isoform X2 [Girardinichthys multiradiatus]|uniref:zona pellucida protein AX 1 isoform X2 n=1 Tax=Girardinichthys multiradiatus TaxID=208333 RepID=UPI001FABB255|nr:zona pellucida protein AX 1 isoform X2 [Girardinichthys multiradiatus]